MPECPYHATSKREEQQRQKIKAILEKQTNMKIIVSGYTGIAFSQIDFSIYQNRIGSNCFILEHCIYNRAINQLSPNDNTCVIDYHDGDYVNFKPNK